MDPLTNADVWESLAKLARELIADPRFDSQTYLNADVKVQRDDSTNGSISLLHPTAKTVKGDRVVLFKFTLTEKGYMNIDFLAPDGKGRAPRCSNVTPELAEELKIAGKPLTASSQLPPYALGYANQLHEQMNFAIKRSTQSMLAQQQNKPNSLAAQVAQLEMDIPKIDERFSALKLRIKNPDEIRGLADSWDGLKGKLANAVQVIQDSAKRVPIFRTQLDFKEQALNNPSQSSGWAGKRST